MYRVREARVEHKQIPMIDIKQTLYRAQPIRERLEQTYLHQEICLQSLSNRTP